MSCCGSKRAEARSMAERTNEGAATPGRFVDRQTTLFESIGTAIVTVQGPVTGTRYHFPGGGIQAAVDDRDAPFLSGVPHLRRVKR